MWTDDTLKLKLLRKGILTRIYAPMVRSNPKPQTLFLMLGFPQAAFIFFFLSQVIIQELREAGVFSSVVTSAHMSLNNSSTVSISRESSQVTGRRRVLESHLDLDTESQASAIPPQSPPGLEATQMEPLSKYLFS